MSRLGVLSLTANPNNDAMWEKYADNHKGYCIGFHSKRLFNYFGQGGEVNYFDALPTIYPRPKHSFEKQNYLQVYSKEKKWKFEEEYRTAIFGYNGLTAASRTIKVSEEVFADIILGKDMNGASRLEIKNIISAKFPSTKIIEL